MWQGLGLTISFILGAVLLVSAAAAQDNPPDVGVVILDDPLASPGVMPSGACQTGRGSREFVEEGYILKVRGKCSDRAGIAATQSFVRGLVFSDGEVRVEFKIVSGLERAVMNLYIRAHPANNVAYYARVSPARGIAQLQKANQDTPTDTLLAERRDLSGQLAPEDWNSLAIRTVGSRLWLLLNDAPVLSVDEPSYDIGDVGVGVTRLGDVSDEEESAAVLRAFRVTALAEGDPARVPTYQRP
jgi:hypothetical protein